jgi:signal transduction histidine kinase
MIDAKPASSIERYQRLLTISRDLASTLELGELLNRIVQAAADLCGAREASILLYDDVKHELRFEAATNLTDPLMRGMSIPVDSSIAGWIVTNKQPVILSEAQQDQRLYRQVGAQIQMPTESLLGVPLISKDKIIGVLEAINKKSGSFSLEDQEMLTTLGAQAAVAIQNALLFQQSDLISDLVHELRTPMASLATAAHILIRSDISSEKRASITHALQEEIKRLAELTTTYLDFSRLESGRMHFQFQELDLKPILEESLDIIKTQISEKGLNLAFDLSDQPLMVHADKSRIQQVIHNLVSNAIKYNSPKGTVTIQAYHTTNEVIFLVRDTGPGISAEDQKKLFTRFFRVLGSEKFAMGTGLGLSICKRIIDAHGGSIHVESQVNKGSTFAVHLPQL